MQTPAWIWQATRRQTQDTAPSKDASELQQHWVTLFPQKKKQRGVDRKKPLPAMACWAYKRVQPRYKHRSGLCFRVIQLTPTTEKRCSLKSLGDTRTHQSMCVGLLALTEPPGDTSRALDS